MIALDTNVVVRFLVGDDEEQARRARRLLGRGDVLVSSTVLLETEWVLRSGYGIDRARVLDALEAFCSIGSVKLSAPVAVRNALAGARQGMDFADALHVQLAAAAGASEFATFDRRLRQAAGDLPIAVKAP